MAKGHKPTPKQAPQRIDIRDYYKSINWAQWWEEWALSVTKEGRFLHHNLQSFVKCKTQNDKRRRLLLWYLGPIDEEHPEYKLYSWCPYPVDWYHKRKTGGWCSEESLQEFNRDITSRINALEALTTAGKKYTLNSLARAEKLAQAIDAMFIQPCLPGLTYAENVARVERYISMQDKALALKEKAQELYAKSLGINFDDMSGLLSIMQAGAMHAMASNKAAELTPERKAIQGLVEMVVSKAHRHKMPLPEGAEDIIIDAVSVGEEDPQPTYTKSKKRDVN